MYRTVLPGVAMIAVSFGLARYGYGLLLPEMQAELSISPGAAGLIASGTYVSYLLANFGVVWLTGRRGPRAAIGLAAALAAAGMVSPPGPGEAFKSTLCRTSGKDRPPPDPQAVEQMLR